MIRVGGKLVDPIHGIGNGKEDEHKTDLLSGFLPGQVVDDEEKEYRIDQHADEFLAGHKFDVSSPVSNDAISHKGQDGPANWWPKQAMARVQPEADQPKAQGRCAQTMKDQEFQGTNCASGQRAEGKNREDQKEDSVPTPFVQPVTAHLKVKFHEFGGCPDCDWIKRLRNIFLESMSLSYPPVLSRSLGPF